MCPLIQVTVGGDLGLTPVYKSTGVWQARIARTVRYHVVFLRAKQRQVLVHTISFVLLFL